MIDVTNNLTDTELNRLTRRLLNVLLIYLSIIIIGVSSILCIYYLGKLLLKGYHYFFSQPTHIPLSSKIPGDLEE